MKLISLKPLAGFQSQKSSKSSTSESQEKIYLLQVFIENSTTEMET